MKGVLNNLDDLATRITEDHDIQKKPGVPLPIDIFTTNAGADQSTMGVNGQFVFSQVLFDCLLRLKSNQTDRAELISYCRSENESNSSELKKILEFERNYTPDKALRWYSKDTFFYKTLNAALRKQNIHMTFLFREFISDIQQQLQEYQSDKVLKVYRGQMMSNEELERLKQSIGKLISINSFLSTTTIYSTALSFLSPSRSLQRIVFEIKADPKVANTKPFANISKHSDYPDESEVLFMIGSIFRLDSIDQNDANIWIIKMSLSSDEEHGLKEVLLYMKKQVGTAETNLRTLGKCLWKMGKFDLAEKYFTRLLNELQPDDPLNSILYEDLAELAALRGEYDMSVQYQEKSLKLKGTKDVNETKSLVGLPSALSKHRLP
jgi:tetratricopeptide (TPR) repeat protein